MTILTNVYIALVAFLRPAGVLHQWGNAEAELLLDNPRAAWSPDPAGTTERWNES